MASKKGSKRKPSAGVVTRRISVPRGTTQIVVHITIGRPGKMMKMAKSGIQDDTG